MDWLIKKWTFIRQDMSQDYQFKMAIASASRSVMSKRGASQLKSFVRKLERAIKGLIPRSARENMFRKRLEQMGAKEGQAIVILEGSEPADSALFKDANVQRR